MSAGNRKILKSHIVNLKNHQIGYLELKNIMIENSVNVFNRRGTQLLDKDKYDEEK